MIVARDDGENNFLEGYRKQFVHLRIDSHEGPLTLIDGRPSFADIELAARIAARYSQGRDADVVQVSAHHPNGVVEALSASLRCRRIRFRTHGMSSARTAEIAMLDARGLICPMPVIRTQDRVKTLPSGARARDRRRPIAARCTTFPRGVAFTVTKCSRRSSTRGKFGSAYACAATEVRDRADRYCAELFWCDAPMRTV